VRPRAVLAALFGVLLLAGTGGSVAVPARALQCAPDDTICQQLLADQASQAAAADQLVAIQAEIKDVVKQINDLTAFLGRLNVQVAAQQSQVDATQSQIDVLDGKIRLTEAEITRRQAHLQVRETLFGERVRSMDKHGSINYLALALSATSFNQLIDRLITTQQVIQSDHTLLDELRAEKTQLQQLNTELASQRSVEADLLSKQQSQLAALLETKRRQQAALAFQQQLEVKFKAEADQVAAQKAQIDAQVAADEAAYAAEAAASGGGTGQFGWPESPHYLSQGFGCSPYPFELYWPSCPSKHFHSGIDIAEPRGQPVMAADNGVVSTYSSCCGYGNYIVLTHGNGYSSLYGHLAGFNVRNGQLVIRGQVIGFEGSTGNSTGPHLHFEIRFNGEYNDPCSYLGC
jgi:murein DD-endopeptidase MepM/ murein hydrolase activator NlpD